MIKLVVIIIIGYFAVMIARILFRMFIRKITKGFNPNPPAAPNNNPTKEQKKKFYDPNKIEEAKFEEIK